MGSQLSPWEVCGKSAKTILLRQKILKCLGCPLFPILCWHNLFIPIQEVCYQYWPAGKSTQSYGEFSVELVNEERKGGFILRALSVLQAKVHNRRRS